MVERPGHVSYLPSQYPLKSAFYSESIRNRDALMAVVFQGWVGYDSDDFQRQVLAGFV
jgi:hypothetical protein